MPGSNFIPGENTTGIWRLSEKPHDFNSFRCVQRTSERRLLLINSKNKSERTPTYSFELLMPLGTESDNALFARGIDQLISYPEAGSAHLSAKQHHD